MADDVDDDEKKPAVLDLVGEFGALGEGPLFVKLSLEKLSSSSLRSSPDRSPELNLRLRKFIPPSKVLRKFENEILTVLSGAANELKSSDVKKLFSSATMSVNPNHLNTKTKSHIVNI